MIEAVNKSVLRPYYVPHYIDALGMEDCRSYLPTFAGIVWHCYVSDLHNRFELLQEALHEAHDHGRWLYVVLHEDSRPDRLLWALSVLAKEYAGPRLAFIEVRTKQHIAERVALLRTAPVLFRDSAQTVVSISAVGLSLAETRHLLKMAARRGGAWTANSTSSVTAINESRYRGRLPLSCRGVPDKDWPREATAVVWHWQEITMHLHKTADFYLTKLNDYIASANANEFERSVRVAMLDTGNGQRPAAKPKHVRVVTQPRDAQQNRFKNLQERWS